MYIKANLEFCSIIDRVAKANSIQFEDMSFYESKIIDSFRTVEDLNLFRLNLYNLIKTKVKIECVKVSEVYNGDILEKQGFKLSSELIKISDNDIGRCCPLYIRKEFFKFSTYLNKFISKENLLYQGLYI